MNPDDLARILDELGRRLGPAGEHVFALAVRQQYIEGWTWLAALGVLAIIAAIVTAVVRWRITEYNRTNLPGSKTHVGFGWRVFCYGAVWSLFFLVAFFFLGKIATQLLNPEYAAIQDILRAVR
jgi:phosphoglycerol transferase MdoB-like AlkP superfamily enzyme